MTIGGHKQRAYRPPFFYAADLSRPARPPAYFDKKGGWGMILESVGEDIKTLRIVTRAYAGREGELTSVLQYVFQSVVLSQRGETELASLLQQIAADEMRHLQIVGSLITRLGAPPVFTANPPYPVGYYSASCVNYARGTEEMLAADLAAEENSVKAYASMLEEMENPAAAEVVLAIMREEREHLRLLRRHR